MLTIFQTLSGLPESHQKVLANCVAEAWRNFEQGDATTEADVAADIAQFMVNTYGVQMN